MSDPYHEGEILVQNQVGERGSARRNGTVIKNEIMAGALRFIEQQPFVVVGSLDAEEDVWASILFGEPGFVKAENQRALQISLSQTVLERSDPFWKNIEENRKVGLLIIELATRRRLRINGEISEQDPLTLRLDVSESYPNCPKYIQRRHQTALREISDKNPNAKTNTGEKLNAGQIQLIHSADTFFVASSHPERGVDASHRGGNAGFVETLDERTLRVPDYIGNSMFNTLGNFAINPKAGLVFFDFEKSRSLQLIGTAEVRFDLDDPNDKTGGTRRFWDFTVGRWVETFLPNILEWEFLDYSPFNPDLQGAERWN